MRVRLAQLIDADELGEGRVMTVTVGHESLCVTRTSDGGYGCLGNACPHQGGPLGEGSIEGGWLRCPWHGYDYSPKNGKPPPPFDDAPAAYRTEVRDDGVYVALPVEQSRERTVSDVLVETMVAWGVTHVFGMVGHSKNNRPGPSYTRPVTIVETQALTQRFGPTVALDALDLQMQPGVTGLVGANGAGKTTLINAMLGLRVPTAGSVTVMGLDPQKAGHRLRAMVGFAPERNVLPDEMRAVDFVRHLAEVRGLPRGEARNRASDTLWLVGLGEERTRTLGTMSTGQRQRVKLAQAIASDPKLVLLDEPTDGLDPVQRSEMLTLIGQISKDFSINVVLSSHQLEEVERVCDSVVALDGGRLVACGPISELVGAGDGITLELVDVAEPARSVQAVESELRSRGLDVQRTETTLRLRGADFDELCDRARDAVAAAGARVRRLETRRRTLEDIFEDAPR